MSTNVETELAAANPVSRASVAELPLAAAEQELLRAIVAQPCEPRAAIRRQSRRRRRFVAVLAAGAAAAAVVFAVVGTGNRPGEPAPAFAAELVRFAERSPLLLLDEPGWRVDYADEQTAVEGEMSFRRPQGGVAELNWRGGTLRHWKRDRAHSAELTTTGAVLGTTATVYQYEDWGRRRPGDDLDITALWLDRGRVLEFRSTVADMATFKRLLAALTRVDTTAWLSAMPASVVKAADQDTAVRAMLKGIPLPPGFDPSKVRGAGLTKDRYQLGAIVTGTVACTWFQRWSIARRDGDEAGVRAAIAALATAKDWPIMREMSKQGGYPDVLEEYAAAMPSGRWFGRPLEGDVNSGLGCSTRGVKLPRP
jgi:hypothetical protein